MRSKLRILGKDYSYIRKPMPEKDGRLHWGETLHSKGTIRVNTDAPDIQQFDTTIHEAIHVIDAELALGLSERSVRCLAVGICGFVLDNPRVFRKYVSRDRGRREKKGAK